MRPPLCVLAALLVLSSLAVAADPPKKVPHGQDRPPNDPYPAAEAAKRMTVPEGFSVEVVAAEPDLVNPVAMTIDEKGRFWVTESLEYPRRPAGPGKDRVKVLEDTDGDGKVDKVTIFAEGLNIPSGIAVGHGGVWVANSPDILFYKIGADGKADGKPEVVVTGFGRDDTHELPNSLTWGPDGWLYGLNGVFNPSVVKQNGKEFRFTCALFRIHPKTREFQLFCEGTSNPWGVAFNPSGDAFVSACVIDHLWHLTESGYYHRQGGPYPPFTWKMESIVKHKHQKAAYCGITWFDSDAYPEQYRGRLYMGNIHGGCVNVDEIESRGATYFGKPNPDFLTANDAWFMPVVQKTGPDGCLYVLDWYDQYHCYQDANRDPQGIDRLKGRLYRVRYKETPRRAGFDLAKESDDALVKLLGSPNVYDRDIAQRLLAERDAGGVRGKLEALVLDAKADRKARMHALFALVGTGKLGGKFHEALLKHDDALLRAWGVRAAGNFRGPLDAVVLRGDPSPIVQLQVAIAARKLPGVAALTVLADVAASCGDDPTIPHVVWQNLHPLLEERASSFAEIVAKADLSKSPGLAAIVPRAAERILAAKQPDAAAVAELFAVLSGPGGNGDAAAKLLEALARRVQTGELTGDAATSVRAKLTPVLRGLAMKDGPLTADAVALLASWKDAASLDIARKGLADAGKPEPTRLRFLQALVAANDPTALDAAGKLVADAKAGSPDFRAQALAALGRLDDDKVAGVVLEAFAKMEPDLQPKAVELLTQRLNWSKALIAAVADKRVPAGSLNVNQVRAMLDRKDEALTKQVRAVWGTIRTERDPKREEVINAMRTLVRKDKGDPAAGLVAFKKVCAQCHKMHGEGAEVGPDITQNGRGSFEQLLSNVFDPSLVIGTGYQAATVTTTAGRSVTGLLVEDGPQRVVLKVQGGKTETFPRADIDEFTLSKLSLMPEGIETQMTPRELADLFAYLTLDKPHTDPTARPIPGAKVLAPREVSDPAKFNAVIEEFAPGFTINGSGEGGLSVLADFRGRPGVLRTHPVEKGKAAVMSAKLKVPDKKRTRLLLAASHDTRGDWQLIVKVDGKVLHDSIIGPKSAPDGWAEVAVDLSAYRGKEVTLEVHNHPNGWSWEHGYWSRLELTSDDGP